MWARGRYPPWEPHQNFIKFAEMRRFSGKKIRHRRIEQIYDLGMRRLKCVVVE